MLDFRNWYLQQVYMDAISSQNIRKLSIQVQVIYFEYIVI